MEQSGAYDGGATGTSSGLVAGACVATTMGWCPVASLTVGDMVLTFDSGLQPITQIARKPIWTGEGHMPRKFWPLHVPVGVIGNRVALDLLPHQFIMIESDAGEELFGDPFSLVKAETLERVGGIEARPAASGQEAIVLHFEREQVVFERSGALFYCPSGPDLLGLVAPRYAALSAGETDALIARIQSDTKNGPLNGWLIPSEAAEAAAAAAA